MTTQFIRVKKEVNYTTIDNTFLRDDSLSAQAKGIFAYILSLPDDWKIFLSELMTHFNNGKDSFNKAIKELEEHGYLIKQTAPSVKGKFSGYNFTVVENPNRSGNSVCGKPSTENEETVGGIPSTENEETVGGIPSTETRQLLNTNKPNTEILNTNKLNLESNNPEHKPSKTRNGTRWSAFEYNLCIDEAVSNQTKLHEKDSKVHVDNYQLSTWRRILKPYFDEYGVEETINGIRNSMNFEWLVTVAHYSFNALFSPKIFPKCIKNTFEKQMQRGPAYSSGSTTDYSEEIF